MKLNGRQKRHSHYHKWKNSNTQSNRIQYYIENLHVPAHSSTNENENGIETSGQVMWV